LPSRPCIAYGQPAFPARPDPGFETTPQHPRVHARHAPRERAPLLRAAAAVTLPRGRRARGLRKARRRV